MGLGSGIRDPGSRGQKGPGSGSATLLSAVAEKNFVTGICSVKGSQRLTCKFPVIVFADFSQRCYMNFNKSQWLFSGPEDVRVRDGEAGGDG
jgi:hypothetical protein